MENNLFAQHAAMVDKHLEAIFEKITQTPEQLKKAMLYSITAGGKRIRPALMLEIYRVCGGDPADILSFACAVEMIHTYSLIHDDLPCMDNDDMRRGKPSNHIAFGESTALLAGDALLTLAFETATDLPASIDAVRALRAIQMLGHAAGMCGMVGGQVLDLDSEHKKISLDELAKIQSGKTVAMIRVNAQIACVLADASPKVTDLCCNYCEYLGRAFQIVDDILDVTGDAKQFGKPIGSDEKSDKNTYVTLLGLPGAQQMADTLTNQAVACARALPGGEQLAALAEQLGHRSF